MITRYFPSSHAISEVGIWWKDVLSSTCSYLLTCKAKTDNNPDISAAVRIITFLLSSFRNKTVFSRGGQSTGKSVVQLR